MLVLLDLSEQTIRGRSCIIFTRSVDFPLASLISRSKVLSRTYFNKLNMQLSKHLLTFPFRISVFKNSVEAFHKHVRVDSETSSETICPLMLPMDPITRKLLMERDSVRGETQPVEKSSQTLIEK